MAVLANSSAEAQHTYASRPQRTRPVVAATAIEDDIGA